MNTLLKIFFKPIFFGLVTEDDEGVWVLVEGTGTSEAVPGVEEESLTIDWWLLEASTEAALALGGSVEATPVW